MRIPERFCPDWIEEKIRVGAEHLLDPGPVGDALRYEYDWDLGIPTPAKALVVATLAVMRQLKEMLPAGAFRLISSCMTMTEVDGELAAVLATYSPFVPRIRPQPEYLPVGDPLDGFICQVVTQRERVAGIAADWSTNSIKVYILSGAEVQVEPPVRLTPAEA